MDHMLSQIPQQYTTGLSRKSASLINSNTSTANEKTKVAARKAATEFEAVFLTTMLEGMFQGLKTDAPFGGGPAEKSYRSMLVGEYAGELARSGGIGIADHVYREILAAQEGRVE